MMERIIEESSLGGLPTYANYALKIMDILYSYIIHSSKHVFGSFAALKN